MWCVEVEVRAVDVELVCDRWWVMGVAGIEERPVEGGRVVLVASPLADHEDRARELAEAAAATVAAAGGDVRAGAVVDLAPATWLDAWRPHAAPTVVAGRVVVRAPWVDAVPIPDGGVEVVVDPGHAWGHGGHATTVVVVEELAEHPPVGLDVLDVGCGAGVLTVAAALLGARTVTAVDIDPLAPPVTAAAASANGVGDRVTTAVGSAGSIAAAFPVVVANIAGAVLVELAGDLARRVAPGGRLVLSGMLDEQLDAVVAAYRSVGLDLVGVRHLDGWASPVLTAPPG